MKIFMMGDSTMKYNNIFRYPQVGWGQVLHLFARNDVLIEDHAENGRSTKSFKEEGRFDVILNRMSLGDFVICSFGHNDEKIQDPTRYTEPYGSYQDNLLYYAQEVEKRGGHIVFATPITRHKFENGRCVNTHGDYPKAMLDFAKQHGYTCIDLTRLTMDLYTKLGEEQTKKFHMIFPKGMYDCHPEAKDDHSHLRYEGGLMVCELFVRAIEKTDDPIKHCFLDLSEKDVIDEKMLID
ncbi:MAG TPA: rhamnogalacturonan acetylesterase [Candidatus Pelethenecus faecipullorum]|uniref:Rhamnogalacturonan acetylesterase n=1 Tax=Candidatus Pelethenecus faecipullorum TaxID=2840900 RepID=A0A9D1GSV8_9MOLU|nr:rhamnogalacturonan acetylesterase [Candidatus Pelethenecus faecipullorum]